MPLPPVYPDETIKALRSTGLRIIQPGRGHRHALDPLLLCEFTKIRPGAALADLGTGDGVIPLLLSASSARRLLGIEVHPTLADRARRSVLLNALQERIEILSIDLRLLPVDLHDTFDVVTANPPYRPIGRGRIAPDAERAATRFELAGGIADFASAASLLLRHGGRCSMVYLAERLPDLLQAFARAGLNPSRLRCVHHRPGERARLVLVEGRKGGRGGMVIEPPLWVEEMHGVGL
jgi:tRNA1Val (adenine37-N6)-methyltransferase